MDFRMPVSASVAPVSRTPPGASSTANPRSSGTYERGVASGELPETMAAAQGKVADGAGEPYVRQLDEEVAVRIGEGEPDDPRAGLGQVVQPKERALQAARRQAVEIGRAR